ncbi:hypothetical protein NBRC116494_03470 [Aurantivibrio plasticivorans]
MRLMVFKLFITIAYCLLFSQSTYSADVYKTVDEHGNITYSDSPSGSSSEKVQLKEDNRMPAPALPATPSAPRQSEEESPEQEIPTSYSVSITFPTHEYHVPPGERSLTVSTKTDPELHSSHTVKVSDNGSMLDGSTINHITPGTHSISAKVVDKRGKTLGRAAAVTVYVHRVNRPRPAP